MGCDVCGHDVDGVSKTADDVEQPELGGPVEAVTALHLRGGGAVAQHEIEIRQRLRSECLAGGRACRGNGCPDAASNGRSAWPSSELEVVVHVTGSCVDEGVRVDEPRRDQLSLCAELLRTAVPTAKIVRRTDIDDAVSLYGERAAADHLQRRNVLTRNFVCIGATRDQFRRVGDEEGHVEGSVSAECRWDRRSTRDRCSLTASSASGYPASA